LKSIIQLFTISALFLVLASSNLTAREVSGSLSAGEGSSFVPSQGSSFSIISDVTSGSYGGNFNIIIKSGGRTIYKESNQVDDLYLVFNEPVDDGDVIKLDVIKGVFTFKMSHMNTLPDVIVEAIKKQAPKEYKQLKPLHKKRKKKIVAKPKIVEPAPIITPKIEYLNDATPQYTPSQIDDSRVVKRHIEPQEYKKEVEKVDIVAPVLEQPKIIDQQVKKESIPSDIAKPITNEEIKKPSSKSSEIDTLSNSIDSINKRIASVINRQRKAIDNSAIKSDIDEVSKKSKLQAPKTSFSTIPKIPMAKTFPMDFDRNLIPVAPRVTMPKTPINLSKDISVPRVMRKKDIDSFKTTIDTTVSQKPKFQTTVPDIVAKKITIEDKISKPKMEVKTIPTPKIETKIEKYVQPEIIAPPVVQEVIQPEIIEKPIIRKAEVKDRIVITKTIVNQDKKKVIKDEPRVIKRHVQPQQYGVEEEQIPQRMSDRVVGSGYGLATPGKIRVKAYSNNRAVSAWVEVFKAGSKERVKTFYTGKGNSLKDVKLPAGVYVIKATYRTAGSKIKKTLGKVTLEEGESINKSISFDDGSLKVKVTKNGNSIYAKVEVFKSGKKRRIAYAFTSKSNGEAKLTLGSGLYDIVVRDHGDVKRFDSIKIRGGKSKTINADF